MSLGFRAGKFPRIRVLVADIHACHTSEYFVDVLRPVMRDEFPLKKLRLLYCCQKVSLK